MQYYTLCGYVAKQKGNVIFLHNKNRFPQVVCRCMTSAPRSKEIERKQLVTGYMTQEYRMTLFAY